MTSTTFIALTILYLIVMLIWSVFDDGYDVWSTFWLRVVGGLLVFGVVYVVIFAVLGVIGWLLIGIRAI